MNIELYLQALGLMLVAGLVTWLISLVKKDVSIVDSVWSLFFVIAAFVFIDFNTENVRSWIILALVLVWALRLSAYITLRHRGQPEDKRYQEIRNNNQPYFGIKSLYLIFIFQALVAWVVALPLLPALHITADIGALDILGIGLWLTGMVFEATADQQLWQFKQNPANRGKVLNRGLWKYFGEFLIWWGYYCFALSNDAWWAIVSPLIMTALLLKFSGVTLLEKSMSKRPGYDEYMKNTNAFFPGPAGGSTNS